jgi:hypothetical protein
MAYYSRRSKSPGILMIVSLSAPMGRRGERVEIKINTPRLLLQLRIIARGKWLERASGVLKDKMDGPSSF